jgi:anti-anti-sigma regulatory factor
MSTVKVRMLNWVAVLRPITDLLGDVTTEELLEAFKSAWAASYQGIVINLSDVQRLDELGMAVLVHCLSLSNQTHTKTAICCWGPGPTKTLDELGWSPFAAPHLRFKSEADAVRYCSER